jgi:hypothetical protein
MLDVQKITYTVRRPLRTPSPNGREVGCGFPIRSRFLRNGGTEFYRLPK